MTHSCCCGCRGDLYDSQRRCWCRRPGYLILVPDNRNGLTESTPISSIEHNSMVEFSDDGNHHRSPREGQRHHQG